ncbi:MAG TPA: AAA family ATPase [Kineosporiaceae bacterium]
MTAAPASGTLRHGRYVLGTTITDGWVLARQETTARGTEYGALIDSDDTINDDDPVAAQVWAASVLAAHGQHVTGWASEPDPFGDGMDATPGWTAILTRVEPSREPGGPPPGPAAGGPATGRGQAVMPPGRQADQGSGSGQGAGTRPGGFDPGAAAAAIAQTVSSSDGTDTAGGRVSEAQQRRDQRGSSHSDGPDTSDAQELLGLIRDGAWLDEQTFPPLRYPVPGLVPEGFTLLIGPPKAGKSWLALNLLLGIASGGKALGRIRTGPARPVLYLALEDGDRRMQSRARKLLVNDPIPPHFHYVTRIPAGQVGALIEAFLVLHPTTSLVVIDTLGKVMPQAAVGESAYQRDYRVGGALKLVADDHPGLGVVVLHHDRKAGAEDFVDAVSGTHGLAGAADAVIVLSRSRHSTEGSLRVTGRDVPEDVYAITLMDGVDWQLDGKDLVEAARRAGERAAVEAASQRYSETTVGILEFVREAGPKGRTTKEITDKFGECGKYLQRRVVDGSLEKPGRGVYVVPGATYTHSPDAVSEPSEVSEGQVIALSDGPDSSDAWRSLAPQGNR